MDSEILKECFSKLVEQIGSNHPDWVGNRQFTGTPDRIARFYEETCWSEDKILRELESCLSRTFQQEYDEMLVTEPISVWTLCPHHLLPCHFSVTVGYIPNGNVLGLSKFARISTILGKRPIMQEEYTQELACLLQDRLKPNGVGVSVTGSHGCMSSRGVLQDLAVTTCCLKGTFLDQPATRQEFLMRVRK
jgi:GTP cyclohydrolase I